MAKTNLLVLMTILLVATFSDDTEGRSPCPNGMAPYRVNIGDTCWQMAGGTPEKVAALMRANPGLDCVRLHTGTVICAPPQLSDKGEYLHKRNNKEEMWITRQRKK
ncbi:hypothetical protein LINGRAHAP2_LOCUS36531 [Linum grandiflorum]